jgi:hypothetical protein
VSAGACGGRPLFFFRSSTVQVNSTAPSSQPLWPPRRRTLPGFDDSFISEDLGQQMPADKASSSCISKPVGVRTEVEHRSHHQWAVRAHPHWSIYPHLLALPAQHPNLANINTIVLLRNLRLATLPQDAQEQCTPLTNALSVLTARSPHIR